MGLRSYNRLFDKREKVFQGFYRNIADKGFGILLGNDLGFC